MFVWVVLSTSLLFLFLTLKNKQTNKQIKKINTGIKLTTHEEYLIEDSNLRLRSAFQSSYSCNVLLNHCVWITTFQGVYKSKTQGTYIF